MLCMLRSLLLVSFLAILSTVADAQSKIGGNPVYINANAYLELGDSAGANKGFLMPRVSLSATNLPTPLTAHVAGMAVYNTATSGTAPNDVLPGVYFNDGTKWLKLPAGAAGAFLQRSDSTVLYITPGQLSTALSAKVGYADTATMLMSYVNAVFNGLSKAGQSIRLGGALIQPTTIGTSSANTLAITGLPAGANTDSVVVAENGTGILKKIPAGSLSNTAKATYIASPGQTIFSVPQPITDINKISLFRNGVRLDVIQLTTTTVQLEPGVTCETNDEIKIIQLY